MKIKISVIIPVYNMARYLPECLDSIVRQTLNDNEIIAVNDGSVDDSLLILKQYANEYKIITILSQQNQGAGVARNNGIRHARGKYIALCEGDDAWIDDKKLQMQVDYMEAHPECSMSAHKAYLQYPADWKGKRDSRAMGYSKEGVVKFNDLFNSWNIATSSFVFRKDLYMLMPEFFRKAPTGDEPLKFYMAGQGNIFYFDIS